LGYTENDLKATINYIRDKVKVVIHLNLDRVMQYLCSDTEYRNQFETGTSGGSLSKTSRLQWEKVLFGGAYDKSEGYEKVKYGALNITNDPSGIMSCRGYGDSFLVLKKGIKNRATFVHGDSSRQDLHIITFSYPVSILNFLDGPDKRYDKLSEGEKCELRDVIEVAVGNKQSSPSNQPFYIEAQIHGPVRLREDVEVLMVNKKHRNDQTMLKLLEEFAYKHKCRYKFIE